MSRLAKAYHYGQKPKELPIWATLLHRNIHNQDYILGYCIAQMEVIVFGPLFK